MGWETEAALQIAMRSRETRNRDRPRAIITAINKNQNPNNHASYLRQEQIEETIEEKEAFLQIGSGYRTEGRRRRRGVWVVNGDWGLRERPPSDRSILAFKEEEKKKKNRERLKKSECSLMTVAGMTDLPSAFNLYYTLWNDDVIKNHASTLFFFVWLIPYYKL